MHTIREALLFYSLTPAGRCCLATEVGCELARVRSHFPELYKRVMHRLHTSVKTTALFARQGDEECLKLAVKWRKPINLSAVKAAYIYAHPDCLEICLKNFVHAEDNLVHVLDKTLEKKFKGAVVQNQEKCRNILHKFIRRRSGKRRCDSQDKQE